MSATQNFQSWLVKARKRAGYTYAILAGLSGVSTATIHGIEHGESSPSLATVEKLCKALDTSVEAALRVRSKLTPTSLTVADPTA